MISKNKKAIVLENTLSVIIAVLGLLLLIYSAYYLYSKLTTNIETESAKEVANLIEKKINALPDNQAANITIRGVNGNNWYLIGFNVNNPNRPNKCFFNSCLCVCKGDSTLPEYQGKICQDTGFCRKTDRNITTNNFEIGDHYTGFKLFIKNNIPLPLKLIELNIDKKENLLNISSYSNSYYDNIKYIKNE